MSTARSKPNEVFTPRNREVNPDMYVTRKDLERKLRRAVAGSQHIIVFGDSGSGKTWLYKKYFDENEILFITVDLSVAVSGGISEALADALPSSEWEPVRRTVKGEAGAKVFVAKAGGSYETEYKKKEIDPLEAVLRELRDKEAKARFIVFDNFEQISRNRALLEEIASLVIRLDNARFAQQGVRFLFVGVVADMKEMIASYDHADTVSNRVAEIPEVEQLSESEAASLIERGLFEKLKIETAIEKSDLIARVSFLSDRNAQQLHELAYEIACEAEENNWLIDAEGLKRAEEDWVETSLSIYRAQIESRMNKRDTKIQRRNQVLFCLGVSNSDRIKAADIDSQVRELFPDSVSASQLGIDQILSSLADGINPILLRNPNEPTYRLAHPKLRPAIRVRLEQFAPGLIQDKTALTRSAIEFQKNLKLIIKDL